MSPAAGSAERAARLRPTAPVAAGTGWSLLDRIATSIAVNRPSLRLLALDECDRHIGLVALLGTLRRTLPSLDLGKRRAVILVRTNRSDLHGNILSELRCGRRVDGVVLGGGAVEFHDGARDCKLRTH